MDYEQLHVPHIINACGTVTRLGGAPIRPSALEAYRAACAASVSMEQLQAAASRRLAQLSGAEAGLVTSGAAAALTLGSAAILTGLDAARMEALPRTDGFPNELIIAREHRNGYDHAIRASGAQLVEVGLNEQVSGAGVRRVETWEFEAAITDKTAGIVYVAQDDAHPPLAEIVALAAQQSLPVIADAAAELPPHDNFQRLATSGLALVAFSGGKVIGGPQETGFLLGRRNLVAAAALQMLDMDDHPQLWDPPADFIDRTQVHGMPRHGIGRSMKVGKQELMAALTALEEFLQESPSAVHAAHRTTLESIAGGLDGLGCQLNYLDHGAQAVPQLVIDLTATGRDAFEVCRQLRQQDPPIYVNHANLSEGQLLIHPLALRPGDIRLLVTGLRKALA